MTVDTDYRISELECVLNDAGIYPLEIWYNDCGLNDDGRGFYYTTSNRFNRVFLGGTYAVAMRNIENLNSA